MKGVFKKVYKIVLTIPKGKVTTYCEIAKILSISPQIVGFALHANKDPNIPCHRIVNKDGNVAQNYAFGGGLKQREKLVKEGVVFVDQLHINLKTHLFNFA